MEKKESKQQQFLDYIRQKKDYKSLSDYYKINQEEIDIEQLDPDKRTPLITAIVSKNYDATKFLLDNKADINKPDSVLLII